MPADVLSDDPVDLVGLLDQQQGCTEAGSVAAEFARQQQIRLEARRLLFTLDVKRKLAAAGQTTRHRDQQCHKGQWVYVWRRAPKVSS